MSLAGKTLFITGASRGIGKAIALRAARDGANVAILAKTEQPHPKLPGTIYAPPKNRSRGRASVADAGGHPRRRQGRRGGEALHGALRRHRILVNNASAISLTSTLETPMKRFDLMFGVNVRGTYCCSQACIPYLKRSAKAGRNPHILNLASAAQHEPEVAQAS